MFRSYRFLLQPTARQGRALEDLLAAQREIYNAALEERRAAWRHGVAIRRFDQFAQLSALHACRPDVMRYGVTVARGTLTRLDRAFQGFFRRVNAGQRPGYPRFKGRHRFDTVSWEDRSGWRLREPDRRLYLQGIGHVKLRLHRSTKGTPKTLHVTRQGRRWWCVVQCADVPPVRLEPTGAVVGIDVGVANLAATSDGALHPNPRPLRAATARLEAAQRALARKQRASTRRRRAVAAVARLHRKVVDCRRDAHHQLSRVLVNRYDLICHEDLRIPNLTRRPKPVPAGDGGFAPNGAAAKAGLNRSILDAGWGQLLRFIAYKAEEAGRDVIAVEPRNTSRRCPACGHTEGANRLTQAQFRCTACGHQAHADVNAAINILRAGLALRSVREAETGAA